MTGRSQKAFTASPSELRTARATSRKLGISRRSRRALPASTGSPPTSSRSNSSRMELSEYLPRMASHTRVPASRREPGRPRQANDRVRHVWQYSLATDLGSSGFCIGGFIPHGSAGLLHENHSANLHPGACFRCTLGRLRPRLAAQTPLPKQKSPQKRGFSNEPSWTRTINRRVHDLMPSERQVVLQVGFEDCERSANVLGPSAGGTATGSSSRTAGLQDTLDAPRQGD